MYFIYMAGMGRPVRHSGVGGRERLGVDGSWLEIQCNQKKLM